MGKYSHSWYRIELQNRGALHLHLLLWTVPDKKVLNEIILAPMKTHPEVQSKVRNCQIHKCQSPRCLKCGKRIYTKCKYGFPFDLCEEDYLDETNNSYKYKRINEEDKNIVLYNPTLLLLWDGHKNIQ